MATLGTALAKKAAPVAALAPRNRARTAKEDATLALANVGATADMLQQAVTVYTENKTMNAATSRYNAARKKLHKEMDDMGLEKFDAPYQTPDNKSVTLVALVAAKDGTAMSARLLYKHMGCDKDRKALERFLDLVNVTKDTVVEQFGTVVANKIEMPARGKPSLSVKPAE